LSSDNAKTIFPAEFLDFVLKGIKSDDQTKTVKANSFSLKASVKRLMPRFLKNAIRDNVSLPGVNHNILAFRVFLIGRMNTILNQDKKKV
jgi:hypothetical protein